MGPLHGAATLAWHAVAASRVGKPQVLSALAWQCGAGEGVARGGNPDATWTQETHAPGSEATRGQLE